MPTPAALIQEAISQRKLYTMKCTYCGSVWDRKTNPMPPCNHSEQDWEDERVKRGQAGENDEESRRRWLIIEDEE